MGLKSFEEQNFDLEEPNLVAALAWEAVANAVAVVDTDLSKTSFVVECVFASHPRYSGSDQRSAFSESC